MKIIIATSKTNGNKEVFVSDKDYKKLMVFKWFIFKTPYTFYAKTKIDNPDKKHRKTISMHRVIMDVLDTPKRLIDHKDHNGLNNTRNNLRICTGRQNAINSRSRKNSSSKYLGVYFRAIQWRKRNAAGIMVIKPYVGEYEWVATIRENGKSTRIGFFIYETDAAKAYDKAAKKHFGKWANLNFK